MPLAGNPSKTSRLRNQARTALRSATREYRATALGGHAGTETVGALATKRVRLEGTFHGELLNRKKGRGV